MDSDKKCKCYRIFKNQELNCCCNRNDKECVCDEVNYNCCTYNGLFGCCTNEQSNLCDCSVHRLHYERRSSIESISNDIEKSENEKLIEEINNVELEDDQKPESSCFCNDNYCKKERSCCCILLGNLECCCKSKDLCCCIKNGNDKCCCHHKKCPDVCEENPSFLGQKERSRLVEKTHVSPQVSSISNSDSLKQFSGLNTSVQSSPADLIFETSGSLSEFETKSCLCHQERKHEICNECISKSIDESFEDDHTSLLTSSCILTRKNSFKKVDETLINELQNIKSESKEKESYDIFIVNNEGEVNSYEVKHLVNEQNTSDLDQKEFKLNQQVHGLCIKNRKSYNKNFYKDKMKDIFTKIKQNKENVDKSNDPIILEITEISNPKSRNAQEIIDNLIGKNKESSKTFKEESKESKGHSLTDKESSLKLSDICSLSKEADILDCLCREAQNLKQLTTANESKLYSNDSAQNLSSDEGFFDDKNYPVDRSSNITDVIDHIESNVMNIEDIRKDVDSCEDNAGYSDKEEEIKKNVLKEELGKVLCQNILGNTSLDTPRNDFEDDLDQRIEGQIDLNIVRDNVHEHLNINVSPGLVEANLNISALDLSVEERKTQKEQDSREGETFDQIIDKKYNLLDCADILLNQKREKDTKESLETQKCSNVNEGLKGEEEYHDICEESSHQNTQSAIRSIDQALGIGNEHDMYDSCDTSSTQLSNAAENSGPCDTSNSQLGNESAEHSSSAELSSSSNTLSSISNEDMYDVCSISSQNTQLLLELNDELNPSSLTQSAANINNISENISSNDSDYNAVEIELHLRDRDDAIQSEQSSTIIFVENGNSRDSIRRNKVGKLIKYFEELEKNK